MLNNNNINSNPYFGKYPNLHDLVRNNNHDRVNIKLYMYKYGDMYQ